MPRKITLRSGPDAGTTKEVPEQTIGEAAKGVFGHGSVTGNADEEKQLSDEDSGLPNRANQSTDHMNQY
jgi:hypothetical protein